MTSLLRRTAGRLLRPFFERRFFRNWPDPPIEVVYWDGHGMKAGRGDPCAELEFRCPSVLADVLASPSTGFGNAYVDGRFRVRGDLQAVLRRAFASDSLDGLPGEDRVLHRLRYPLRFLHRIYAPTNARFHYDLGNEFFRQWLDPSMTYSCAYFREESDDLATAQQQKLELICRKLNLKPGLSLLDVGCGWGSLLFHAVERYGVNAVGVTPSREQAAWIHAESDRRGISSHVNILPVDWRSVEGAFDRVVSVGMFEHVGKAYGRSFLKQWHGWLKPGGISLLHTIGKMTATMTDPWIERNIFPGGYLPAIGEIVNHISRAGMIVADVENLWRHYALTLERWAANFSAARRSLEAMTDEQFMRRWWLYLNGSQAVFAAGHCHLWQIVIAREKTAPLPLTRLPWLAADETSPEIGRYKPARQPVPIE